MALGALMALTAGLLASPGPATAIVRNWPAGDTAAVVMVIGMHPEEVPADKSGLEALMAEVIMGRVSRAVQEKTGAAAPMAKAMPSGRNIEVDRQREYMTITIDVVGDGVPSAIAFLRQAVLEPKWTQEDLDQAKSAVIARRARWLRQVVTKTEDLMLRALTGNQVDVGYFGDLEGLRNVTLADLQALRARSLTKRNVRVSVEGPGAAESKAVKSQLASLVARLPEGMEHKPRAPWIGRRTDVADNPNIDRASLALGFPVAAFGRREYWAACILREMLAGSGGTLVADKKLPNVLGVTVAPSADDSDWPVQPLDIAVAQKPYLAIHAVCVPDSVGNAADAVLADMKDLVAGKFTDAQIWRARKRVANEWAQEIAPIGQRAEMRGIASLCGAELPDVEAVTAMVNAVPKSMLQSVAKDMIARMAIGVQMPRN